MRPVEPPPSRFEFPTPRQDDDDLLAFGADLEPGTILAAYRAGIFPMRVDGRLGWWSPDPRGVLPLDGLKVTKSLRRSRKRFEIRIDTAFVEVMEACADPSRDGMWITPDFVEAYTELHRLGWAHSVEAWNADDQTLAGGLYGLAVGGLFAGESMFHRETDASKVALMGLVDWLNRDGCGERRLIDVQWRTEHLATLGVVEMPRSAYLRRVQDLVSDASLPPIGTIPRNPP